MVFEVLGRKGEVDLTMLKVRDRFAAGLACYRTQAWSDATAEFEACIAMAPTDRPSQVFLERISHFEAHAPESSWNGVWSMTDK